MEVASTAEEVTVNSTAPTIDLESATVGVNHQPEDDGQPAVVPQFDRHIDDDSGVHSTSFDIGQKLRKLRYHFHDRGQQRRPQRR